MSKNDRDRVLRVMKQYYDLIFRKEEIVQLFKALGDKNRLRIIKLLMKDVATTQELASRLQISEAAVSKHLKILNEANLVRKTKNGFYMEYRFDEEMIRYIPYRFYEVMMM